MNDMGLIGKTFTYDQIVVIVENLDYLHDHFKNNLIPRMTEREGISVVEELLDIVDPDRSIISTF